MRSSALLELELSADLADVVVFETTFPFASVTVVVIEPSELVTTVVVSAEDDEEDESELELDELLDEAVVL